MRVSVYAIGLAASLLFSTTGWAELEYYWDNIEDAGASKVEEFWQVSGDIDYVAPASFNTAGFTDEHVDYFFIDGKVRYTKLLGCECDCGMFVSAGYSDTGIKWKQNPNFHQDNFNNLCLDVGGFSSHFPGWLWKTNLGLCLDLDHFKLADYTLYTFTLWGRYELYPCLGLDMGMIAITGLDKNKAWPIIGIDYNWADTLKINLIYPVDLSVLWMLSSNWSVGVAHRFFWTRHRVGVNEPVPRSLVEYRNSGTEGRIVFTDDPAINISAHAGYTWGNDLIITDQNGHNGTHYKFDGAAYVGGDFSVKF